MNTLQELKDNTLTLWWNIKELFITATDSECDAENFRRHMITLRSFHTQELSTQTAVGRSQVEMAKLRAKFSK